MLLMGVVMGPQKIEYLKDKLTSFLMNCKTTSLQRISAVNVSAIKKFLLNLMQLFNYDMIKIKKILFLVFCSSLLACEDDNPATVTIAPAITENQILEAQPSSELVLQGRDLDYTEKVWLNEEELSFSSRTSDQLSIALPETAASGVLSIAFKNSEDTINRFLKIMDNSFSSKDLNFHYLGGISIINDHSAMLYADGSIYKTTDGGDSWNKSYENTLIADENTFKILDEDHIWLTQYGEKELAFSNDGGQTWEEMDALPRDEYRIEEIFYLGEDKKVALAARNTKDEQGRIFVKDQEGDGWTQQHVSQQASFYRAKACYVNGNTVYLMDSGNGLLLKTTNGGETWTESPLNLRLHPSVAEAISFIDANTAWAYNIPGIGGRDPGIYKTNDGGESWELIHEPVLAHSNEVISAIHFTNELEGIAVTSKGGYMLTEDGGLHWKLYYLPGALIKFIGFGQQSIFFYNGSLIRKSL